MLRYQWVSNRILSGAHQSLSSRREKRKFENFCGKRKFENFCEKQKFENFCWWGRTWGTACLEIRNKGSQKVNIHPFYVLLSIIRAFRYTFFEVAEFPLLVGSVCLCCLRSTHE